MGSTWHSLAAISMPLWRPPTASLHRLLLSPDTRTFLSRSDLLHKASRPGFGCTADILRNQNYSLMHSISSRPFTRAHNRNSWAPSRQSLPMRTSAISRQTRRRWYPRAAPLHARRITSERVNRCLNDPDGAAALPRPGRLPEPLTLTNCYSAVVIDRDPAHHRDSCTVRPKNQY